MPFSIAIDGPAGAGKGTIAKFLSQEFCLKHLDTGLLYREAARLVIQEKADVLDVVRLEEIAAEVDIYNFMEEKLRSEEIASVASQVAVVPSLRRVLTKKMRDFAENVKGQYQGVVLDGRDVGTVILPDANIKIYVTADEQVRALRRTKELNSEVLENILKDIKRRDERDENREVAPMQVAQDAIILDTTFLTIEEACKKAATIVKKLMAEFQHS